MHTDVATKRLIVTARTRSIKMLVKKYMKLIREIKGISFESCIDKYEYYLRSANALLMHYSCSSNNTGRF